MARLLAPTWFSVVVISVLGKLIVTLQHGLSQEGQFREVRNNNWLDREVTKKVGEKLVLVF